MFYRHPAYIAGNIMCFGVGLAHLVCPEALALQILGQTLSYTICGLLWTWLSVIAVSRAIAEDEEMHREFGKRWEEYAGRVRWWFCPGVI